MRLLFLDIDGVLNCASWFHTQRARHATLAEINPTFTWEEVRNITDLDPAKVELLNRLFEEVEDLSIVISSSWRKANTIGQIARALRYHGFKYSSAISGMTPGSRTGYRGDEVQEYLKSQKNVTSVAIVDDANDMKPYMHLLISTEWEEGLQEHQVQEIIKLLKEDSYES